MARFDGAYQIVAAGLYGTDLINTGFHQLRIQYQIQMMIGLLEIILRLIEFCFQPLQLRVGPFFSYKQCRIFIFIIFDFFIIKNGPVGPL